MCSTQRTRQVMCFILELWEKEGKVSKDLLMPMVAAGYDLSLAFSLLRVAVLRYWSPRTVFSLHFVGRHRGYGLVSEFFRPDTA